MKVRRKKSKRRNAEKEHPAEPEDNQKLFAFTYEGVEYLTQVTRKFTSRKPYVPRNPKQIFAFIPGTIVKVFVKEKEKVKKGESLLSLQAMKMNNEILAVTAGTVRKIHVKKGDVVVKNQLLVEFR